MCLERSATDLRPCERPLGPRSIVRAAEGRICWDSQMLCQQYRDDCKLRRCTDKSLWPLSRHGCAFERVVFSDWLKAKTQRQLLWGTFFQVWTHTQTWLKSQKKKPWLLPSSTCCSSPASQPVLSLTPAAWNAIRSAEKCEHRTLQFQIR